METTPIFDIQILDEIEAALIFTTTPHYLNRFDVLILIALKRFGLYYNCRRKIINHYRKICDRREFEREIQQFIFSKSTSDKALRLPFQQGMNNLVPIRRKYGPVFERHYLKHMSNIDEKRSNYNDQSTLHQHHGPYYFTSKLTRPQKIPFQQGMNNLVPIFRKYGYEVFNMMYRNYIINISKKHFQYNRSL